MRVYKGNRKSRYPWCPDTDGFLREVKVHRINNNGCPTQSPRLIEGVDGVRTVRSGVQL